MENGRKGRVLFGFCFVTYVPSNRIARGVVTELVVSKNRTILLQFIPLFTRGIILLLTYNL